MIYFIKMKRINNHFILSETLTGKGLWGFVSLFVSDTFLFEHRIDFCVMQNVELKKMMETERSIGFYIAIQQAAITTSIHKTPAAK